MAAGLTLAACGGSDGLTKTEEQALQDRLQAAENAQRLAEQQRQQEQQRRQQAEQQRQQEQQRRQQAEQQRQQEQQARQEAEAERDELQEENDAQQLAPNRDLARDVDRGLRNFRADTGSTQITPGATTITPRYNAGATVVTDPIISQRATTTGSLGGWFKTSISGRAEGNLDRLDVYSNVEAPTPVPFKDSTYNSGGTIVNAEGNVVGAHTIVAADGPHTVSSAFPRESSTPTRYSLTHRGPDETEYSGLGLNADGSATDAELETAGIARAQYNQYRNGQGFRNADIYPFRYTYSVGGTLQGASGTYRCGAATNTGASPCTVQNRGEHFVFAGTWTFRPSSGTTTVRVPDAEFMYFGWWSRQGRLATEDVWSFQTFHGTGTTRVDAVTGLSGPATYRGPAVGYYSLNEEHPDIPSEFGEFTATATLEADFGASGTDVATVGGTIDGFSGQPDWSLTLAPTTFASSTFTGGGVTWSIGTRDRNGGTWQADFFSDLPSAERTGTVPSGIAGQFTALFSDVGSMVGAFGAEKQ